MYPKEIMKLVTIRGFGIQFKKNETVSQNFLRCAI